MWGNRMNALVVDMFCRSPTPGGQGRVCSLGTLQLSLQIVYPLPQMAVHLISWLWAFATDPWRSCQIFCEQLTAASRWCRWAQRRGMSCGCWGKIITSGSSHCGRRVSKKGRGRSAHGNWLLSYNHSPLVRSLLQGEGQEGGGGGILCRLTEHDGSSLWS